jgi:hypothetical protein
VPRPRYIPSRRACAALVLVTFAAISYGCGALPFTQRPAAGYTYASQAPLRIAVIDATGHADWGAAIQAGASTYAEQTPYLQFDAEPGDANIVITVRRYTDDAPPALKGYTFQPGVAAFVAVYDVNGRACNFPPSPLPLNCNGEIARGDVYLNDAIKPGDDIAERRLRLVLHEFGHAMGLTRHSSSLSIDYLNARYGW